MTNKILKKLIELREKNSYTQENLAQLMNISRVTLANIESGKRAITNMDFQKYSDIFDMPANILKQGIIEIPQKKVTLYNQEKFKELLLYILHKVGMKPNIGKTVIYKLLYFCDFDYYEKYGKSITGISYIKLPRGPAPYKFDTILKAMENDKDVATINMYYKGYIQQRIIPNRNYQKILSITELEIVNEVLKNYSDANASEISEYSHGDIPRKKTKDMEIINYELTKKRTYPYSIIQREKKKKEALAEINISGIFSDLAHESDLYERYR